MTNQPLTDPIETIVKDEISKIAFSTIVKVIKVYGDGYCDVKNDEYGTLRHVRSIISHNVGDVTVLIFCDNNYGDRIII